MVLFNQRKGGTDEQVKYLKAKSKKPCKPYFTEN